MMKNAAYQEEMFKILEETRRLYEDEGLSLSKVGSLLGISRQGVQERLKRIGVKRRERGHSHEVVSDQVLAEMRRIYEDEVISVEKISQRYGIPKTVASERLKRAGAILKVRPKMLIAREKLYDLYVTQRLSYDKIEILLGHSHSVVARELRRHGIAPRPRYKLILLDCERLRKLRITDGLSTIAISGKLGVSKNIVTRELRRCQIEGVQPFKPKKIPKL